MAGLDAPIWGEPVFASREKQLSAAKRVLEHLAERLDARFSVQLWDGSKIPMGRAADTPLYVSISGPGVIGSLIRRPTVDNLVRHYATGRIALHGGSTTEFGEIVRSRRSKKAIRKVSKSLLFRGACSFLFAKSEAAPDLAYGGDEMGHGRSQREEKDFIQFHYDIGNDFYSLLLDPEMQYSCGYFRDGETSLERAQLDKLEMICRKLRLQKDEKLLDIGCGWGGLICYAAEKYGVEAYGVTLSQEQHDFAQAKIKRMGLSDRVRVELRNYMDVEGRYDKISSIGMFEHVGIANFDAYFKKMNGLLLDRGILLNHAIANRAKRGGRRLNAEKRFILKYIFPGSELADVGRTIRAMEKSRFEVHDVEGWRDHYARTTRLWCQRLESQQEKAISIVGAERYRLWIAYLTGVSFAFEGGSIRIFQVVATKSRARGPTGMPPTREHLHVAAKSG